MSFFHFLVDTTIQDFRRENFQDSILFGTIFILSKKMYSYFRDAEPF